MNNLFKSTTPYISDSSRSINNNEKKKLDFKTMKNNTISSLNDVEYFLNNFHKISRYMKLFKLFK